MLTALSAVEPIERGLPSREEGWDASGSKRGWMGCVIVRGRLGSLLEGERTESLERWAGLSSGIMPASRASHLIMLATKSASRQKAHKSEPHRRRVRTPCTRALKTRYTRQTTHTRMFEGCSAPSGTRSSARSAREKMFHDEYV